MIKIFNNIQVPTDRSIVVFATYRSGSTAFCDYLSRLTGFPNYDELFHPSIPIEKRLWRKKFQTPCIIKIMADHKVPKEYESLVAHAFVISLTRRSIIEQTASCYICSQTGHWHDTVNDSAADYAVAINDYDIEDILNYMLKVRDLYKNNKIKKDVVLYYEDIKTDLTNSKFVNFKRPTNYQELVDRVEYITRRNSK